MHNTWSIYYWPDNGKFVAGTDVTVGDGMHLLKSVCREDGQQVLPQPGIGILHFPNLFIHLSLSHPFVVHKLQVRNFF